MASSYLISNFLFQYPSGWIADRWGRKPIMIVSLFLQAVVSATYLLIADPILFVLVRFVEGAVAAAFLPSARALITDAIPLKHRGEAFGIFSAWTDPNVEVTCSTRPAVRRKGMCTDDQKFSARGG